jgi:hypothetical protein
MPEGGFFISIQVNRAHAADCNPPYGPVDLQKYRVNLMSGSAPATLAQSPVCASSEGETGSFRRVIACQAVLPEF